MEVRSIEGQDITVAAADGTAVYLAIQNLHHHRIADGGAATFPAPKPLNFGNRRELEGCIWTAKKTHRLIVERAHGS